MEIKNHLIEVIRLCKKYDVESLAVFGSVLTEKISDSSNIDFLVTVKNRGVKGSFDQYFSLKEDLENLLRSSVDLVFENRIRNPYFKENVIQTKQVLYAA